MGAGPRAQSQAHTAVQLRLLKLHPERKIGKVTKEDQQLITNCCLQPTSGCIPTSPVIHPLMDRPASHLLRGSDVATRDEEQQIPRRTGR